MFTHIAFRNAFEPIFSFCKWESSGASRRQWRSRVQIRKNGPVIAPRKHTNSTEYHPLIFLKSARRKLLGTTLDSSKVVGQRIGRNIVEMIKFSSTEQSAVVKLTNDENAYYCWYPREDRQEPIDLLSLFPVECIALLPFALPCWIGSEDIWEQHNQYTSRPCLV